jgi:gluconate 2-dehydrogenase gamma chain
MNTSDDQDSPSRRSFLLSSGGLLTSVWLGTHWSAIAAAAHHAEEMAAAPTAVGFQFFSPGDAADVGAIAAQIVPSGATPGAREAHAVYFTDRALSTFFAGWAPDYRAGLTEFQSKFRAANPAAASFAAASSDEQIAFLKTVDHTPFFQTERTLTLLGMFTSPKYGGNYEGSGWKLMGFEDRHIFAPPFGYYDAEYAGFVPYGTDKQV